ncbi:MAG: sigma-70 family RNA polymerase sigma factor [Planctomycetota bacterium]|nr:sigma-70 family RNA polymerase sigma factor [Planctomycetota bacterium]
MKPRASKPLSKREEYGGASRRPRRTDQKPAGREAEGDLVRRLQAGEEAAYRELVDVYRDRIVTVVRRVAGNEADAEDLAQETFIKAIRGIGKFAGKSALFTWLYRIAVNTARDHLDSRRRRPAVSLDALGEEGGHPFDVAGPTLPPLAELEREELRQRVRKAVDRLPEPFRTTLALREMEGHSYEEIASILEVSMGTVESRIFRARQKLRALILEDMP